MTFKDFILLEAFIAQYSAILSEHVIDDLNDLRKERDSKLKYDTISRLLFYVKNHAGSAGNIDIKMFYGDESIADKVSQLEMTIKNHPKEFADVSAEVADKFKRRKQYDVYSTIEYFFANSARVPAGMQV